MKRKLSLYEKAKKEIGRWPSFTCPKIDAAIDELDRHRSKTVDMLEKLRNENEKLRDVLENWRDLYKNLSADYENIEKMYRELEATYEALLKKNKVAKQKK